MGVSREKSVFRDHRSRVEPVIELDQHFVGLEILVTGDVGIEAANRYRDAGDNSADGGNRAEAEIVAAVFG